MTNEIGREEFEVEFRRLEGEWEVLKKEAGIKEYNKRKLIKRKKEEEIKAEQLELKARKIVEKWNNLSRKAGIDIIYDIQVKAKESEKLETNNTAHLDTRPSDRKIRKIINISSVMAGVLNMIQIPFINILLISAIQLNMFYQINKKFNVRTGMKMLIGNITTITGVLLLLQVLPSYLSKIIPFPATYISVGIAAIIVKLLGEAHMETLKNRLDI